MLNLIKKCVFMCFILFVVLSQILSVSGAATSQEKATLPSPVLQYAATNGSGTTIQLSFDLRMAENTGKQAQFIVTADGKELPVASIQRSSSYGTVLLLNLAAGNIINSNQVVKVSYNAGDVKSEENGRLLSFKGYSIDNRVSNVTQAWTSEAGTVCLIFSNYMNNPEGTHGDYRITINKVNVPVKSIRWNTEYHLGSMLYELIPATPVKFGDKVTVSYVKDPPAYQPFEENKIVQNRTPVEPPVLLEAQTDYSGRVVILSFSKEMADPSATPAWFELIARNKDGNIKTLKLASRNLDNNKSNILLKLDSESIIAGGDTLTLSYRSINEYNGLLSTDNGFLKNFSREVRNLTNAAPEVLSAETDLSGKKITLAFSTQLTGAEGKHALFQVKVDDAEITVKEAASNLDGNKIILTLDKPVLYGQTVQISYKGGSIKVRANGQPIELYLEPFTGMEAENCTVEKNTSKNRFLLVAGTEEDPYFTGYFLDADNIGASTSILEGANAAGTTKVNKIVLKREITLTKKLAAWYKEAETAQVTKRTAYLTLLDKKGRVTAKWKLNGAWLCGLNNGPDENDLDLYVETATLTCDKITRLK